MAELKQFTLLQLKQLIDGDNEQSLNLNPRQTAQLVENYITQNLAITRSIRYSLVQHQFNKGPLVMPEMRILVVTRGWAEPMINLTRHRLEVGDLVFAGPNSILQISDVSEEVCGIGLSMSNDLFSLVIGNRIPKAFDGHLRDFVFHLGPKELELIDELHNYLYMYARKEDHSSQALLHLLSAYLWHIDHLWSQHEEANRKVQSREERLFSSFLQLVNCYATQQHGIDFYAGQLCLSPRYMSALVKKVSGKAAKEWIDDAIVTRIKVDLHHSEKTMAQIAYDMNFPNPSFFSKYFKRLTGMTPLEYKNR